MGPNGTTFHGGRSTSTLSTEGAILYQGIRGTRTINNTDHPALANTATFGGIIESVIRSPKTVYVVFDPKLTGAGETDFVSANFDDEITIRLNAANASGNYGKFLLARKAFTHELVHANQAITDPSRFRDRSYYNVYDLEYEAYDTTARLAAELGGDHAKVLDYVPEYFLQKPRYNPNSSMYRSFIQIQARKSARTFR